MSEDKFKVTHDKDSVVVSSIIDGKEQRLRIKVVESNRKFTVQLGKTKVWIGDLDSGIVSVSRENQDERDM